MIRIVCKDNKQWREERAKSIGASSIGILFGENHFITPAELAERMRAELNGIFDYDENMAMRRGHAYESGVAELFEFMTGKQVIKASSAEFVCRREDIPYMHCSPDRTYWVDDEGLKHGKNAELNKGILECKTTKRKVDAENPPLSWQYQLQVQMGIMGYKYGCLAWDELIKGGEFGYKFYAFDEDIFEAARILCEDFWNRCIIGGETPEPTELRDMLKLYPESEEGKIKTIDNDTCVMIEELKSMKQTAKELDSDIKEMEDRVKMLFDDAEILSSEDGTPMASYKTTAGRTTIDSKTLKAEHPDIYEQYSRTSQGSRMLRLR